MNSIDLSQLWVCKKLYEWPPCTAIFSLPWLGKKRLGPDLLMVLRVISGELHHYSLFLRQPLRHQQKEISTVGRTSAITHGHTFCLEGEMARCAIVHWFRDCSQWVCLMIRDLETTWLKNIWEKHPLKTANETQVNVPAARHSANAWWSELRPWAHAQARHSLVVHICDSTTHIQRMMD